MIYNTNTGYNDKLGGFSKDIKISYKGPVDERIFRIIGDYISSIDSEYEKAGRKLFKIFFELAQNISSYSAEKITFKNKKEIGTGNLIIKEIEDNFVLITGNLVKNKDIIPIIEKCEYINSLDRDALRERLGLNDRFAAIYFGAMGLANGLEYVVKNERSI